ncbi:MAG: formate dehydrogenase accessory sulfurtransferase FdhD [Myxococcales bacterium]|nr:formate dehydrogenase accessory sulfurtransferase FdhD [Myxococcales bacterium]MCB9733363.1 formate dehydrogenase accessory sulfurtransferase FdhD [Deltaproteobacteria bacterium]
MSPRDDDGGGPVEEPLVAVRVRRAGGEGVLDVVAVEEPLAIRVDDRDLVVLMRTPGDDAALAAGFLRTEGIIEDRRDLAAFDRCRDPADRDAANVWLARLAEGAPDVAARLDAARRPFVTGTSCGLCGKTTLASVLQAVRPHAEAAVLPRSLLTAMTREAAARQPLFAATGGLHGASLFALAPPHPVLAAAEDVGRHNAVDKVVGRLVLAGADAAPPAALWVSGRASFEIVQKALVAGFRALVCVGAPTSLAVALAAEARLTLVGFLRRDGACNEYSGDVAG